MVEILDDSDLDFLDALRHGESARQYAARNNYSMPWAKWKSRSIRDKLGLGRGVSIKEAVRLSEEAGVTRSEFEDLRKLISQTNEAIEALAKAPPQQKEAAQAQVQERQLDEKEMAKRLGISLDDVKRVREEAEFEKFKKFQERLSTEQAAVEAEEEEREEEPVRDGLGGISNIFGGQK